jgi:hypothetical protein
MDVIVEHQALTRTSSGSVIGPIWLLSNDDPRIEFPEAGWTDFPVVILGWWLAQVESVLRRASVEANCSFMDGPFEFRIDDTGQVLLRERRSMGTQETAASQVSLQEFWQNLNVAASQLVSECDRRGWSNSDIDRLRHFIVEP